MAPVGTPLLSKNMKKTCCVSTIACRERYRDNFNIDSTFVLGVAERSELPCTHE